MSSSGGLPMKLLSRGLWARFLMLLLVFSMVSVSFGSAANARSISPDPMDPTLPGVGTNRYAYALNDPINNSDSSGHFAVAGAIVGAVIGLAVQAAMDTYHGQISGVGAYAGAAVGGAVAGATAGLASGLGAGVYGASITSGVTGNVAAGVTEKAVNGQAPSVASVTKDAVTGAAFGIVGGVAGARLSGSLNELTAAQKGLLGENLTRAQEMVKGYADLGKVSMPAGGKTPTGLDRRAIIDHNFESVLTGNTKAVESKFGNSAGLSKNQRDALGFGAEFDVNHMTPDSVSGVAGGTAAGGAAAGGNSKTDSDPY